jgi:hypothetical protein
MGDDAPLSSAEPTDGLREDVQAILRGAVLLRELVGWGHRGQTYPPADAANRAFAIPTTASGVKPNLAS